MTPEAIVFLAFASSLVAALAFCLAATVRAWFALAIVALLVRTVADFVDGDLARLRGEVSDHGMFLDFFLDDVAFTAIFLAIGIAGHGQLLIFAGAAAVFLLSDILSVFRIHLVGRYEIGFVGPSEVATAAIVVTLLAWWRPGALISVGGIPLGWFDVVALVAMTYAFIDLFQGATRLYAELRRTGR
ncbi:MAG: CDP-alcohol phosphatidyltransferase family protein [Chthoniobacteraceae bacterium]